MIREWTPEGLQAFAFFPPQIRDAMYGSLAGLADKENWGDNNRILKSYIDHTYRRLERENKISFTRDNGRACFNTGLFTPGYEEIFAVFTRNTVPNHQPYYFKGFFVKSDKEVMSFFSPDFPRQADYFFDPPKLIFNPKLEIVIDTEHILSDNIGRIPATLQDKSQDVLSRLMNAAIEEAKKRAKMNWRLAVPQYYQNKIQLLLPLYIGLTSCNYTNPDAALVIESLKDNIYQGVTILTVEMAYNNARLIAKPNSDWLKP